MKKKTQADIVMDILRKDGKIDNFYVMDNKISIRLGAIIHSLKEKGLIELIDEKCGFIPCTKNYRYVIKPLKPKEVTEYRVNGELIHTKTIW